MRRIIRRACRHGNKLGARGTFFHKIVAALVAEMGDAFPELKQQQAHIERVLKTEEEQFAKTLEQGLKILEQDLAELQGSVIPGNVVFKLYDTYGFPVDLTNDIARERELTIDEDGFEREMEAQRERARASSAFGMDYNSLVKVDGETRFLGYQGVSGAGQIVALFRDGQAVERLEEGEEGRRGPRPDAVLRRVRRPGRRQWLPRGGWRALRRARYHQGWRRAPAPWRGSPGAT
ncbi:alanyl-tRNA ligase [Pseudomonas aeruginosa]|nr:alanyl-tRNA ligase [Pseudomonas aeruginosa]